MKRISYTNRQLSEAYWKEKEEDFEDMYTSNKQREVCKTSRKTIRYCEINIPQFYWNHGGRLTKLDVIGINPSDIPILKNILEEKLGKPKPKQKEGLGNFPYLHRSFLNLTDITKKKST